MPSGPLERYVQVMEALGAFPDGLSAVELEGALGIPRATLNRLLHTMLAADLIIVQGRRGGRFFLGNRLINILRSDVVWLQTASERSLTRLAKASGQTSFLARRAGNSVRSIAMKAAEASVGVYVDLGVELPRHASASGKLLSAVLGRASWDDVAAGTLERLTDRTIVERGALKAEFDWIVRKGYALDRSEHVDGLASIAVPVAIGDQTPAFAVGLTGPAVPLLARAESEYLDMLRRTAAELGGALSMHSDSVTKRGADA